MILFLHTVKDSFENRTHFAQTQTATNIATLLIIVVNQISSQDTSTL